MNFEENELNNVSDNQSDESQTIEESVTETETITPLPEVEPITPLEVNEVQSLTPEPVIEDSNPEKPIDLPDLNQEIIEPVAEKPTESASQTEIEQVVEKTAIEDQAANQELPSSSQDTEKGAETEKPVDSPDKNKSAKSRATSQKQEHFERLFKEVQQFSQDAQAFEVTVANRIRGGLRVTYKDIPMFLPASHFQLKRTPTEQELQDAVGNKLSVMVHEIQEYDEGKKAVIVSRKKIVLEEFWNKLSIGDIVEGKISSIASFGIFVDIGGVEGLVHISRLSKVRVDNPSRLYKKGDIINVVIIEIDREKNRIALSRKELEESPWKNMEQLFPIGTQHKGVVRRLTDFGAYIELKPGVDGLLRASELSWTKRIKQPSDLLKIGQEIQIEILAISEDKQTASLSYKNTLPNPWHQMADRFPVGTEIQGTIVQVMPQGATVSVSEDVDGFMPRSKMRGVLHGKKIPYQSGDKVDVIIADLNVDDESLILAPKSNEEFSSNTSETKPERTQSQSYNRENTKQKSAPNGSFSLGDLLSKNDLDQLNSMSK